MQTRRALFGILTIALTLACRIQAQSFLTNGLVAYYPFNGNANDASGNGNNLTNHGATLCPDRFGVANQAYSFNGSAYLGSSNSPLSQTDNWTVTAWIQTASLSQTTAYAVCVGYDTGNAGDGYGMGISGGSGVEGGSGTPGNRLWAFFPGLGFISDAFLFTSNQWDQVVMLRSSGTLMFYVNGDFTTNSLPNLEPGQTILEPTSFEIGSGGSARFFDGAIDEVRLYNRPLSPSEVQQLYQYDSTPQCTVPTPATATATITNGFVIAATVTDGGCGYTNTPLVTILGGGGTGATATALVTNGVVVGIMITDAGSDYTSAPIVYISSPLGVQIGILQAVLPTFSDLAVGSNYQLQASTDLSTWTNQGSAFTATNAAMPYSQYFNVTSWSQLYFRLQAVP